MKEPKMLFSFITLITLVTLGGCVSSNGVPQGQVAMVDVSERARVGDKLNMTDLLSLAEKLTDEMLMSDVVSEWGSKRPRLIFNPLQNNTRMDNIPEEQIYDRVKGIILESGVARVMSQSANNFDYILFGVLDSTYDRSLDGSSLRDIIVQLNLATIDGEELGRWKGRIKLAKGKRPLF